MRRKLNAFNLSHEHKLTMDMGYLVPNLLLEVLPGDTIDLTTDIFTRMEALLAPVMHRYELKYRVFYWPTRCAMPNHWQGFITGGKDGDDSTVAPYMMSPATGYARGSLGDYLGCPCDTRVNTSAGSTETSQITQAYKHSAVPFRMYAEIYNQYFINENLQTPLTWSDQPGADVTTNTTLQKCNWSRDYFTSALDDLIRAQSPVYLPLGTTAPVVGNGKPLGLIGLNQNTTPDQQPTRQLAYGGTATNYHDYTVSMTSGYEGGKTVGEIVKKYQKVVADVDSTPAGTLLGLTTLGSASNVVADLTGATSSPIDDLRKAFRLNWLLELNKRAGYRIVEWTLAHFGIRVPDDRIQEPIYLGGGSAPIMITPVEQTSSTDNVSPQGNLTGRGTSALRSRHIRKTFVEHGFVMGIISIMPKAEYSQGLHKMWSRETRYDYYLPALEGSGDQPILEKELFITGDTSKDDVEFGYKPYGEEYRTMPSSVHGEMRKGGSLQFWTGGREFEPDSNGEGPKLNSTFVEANPSDRIFAVQDGSTHHFTVECLHHCRMLRPIDKYGTPGLI